MIEARLSVDDGALARVVAAGWEQLARAVVYFHTETLKALNTSNPRPHRTPSRPGEPPRKRTGWLQRNVLYDLNRAKLSGRVGVTVNARYGVFLEVGTRFVKPRPWLLGTLRKVWNRLKAIAEGG